MLARLVAAELQPETSSGNLTFELPDVDPTRYHRCEPGGVWCVVPDGVENGFVPVYGCVPFAWLPSKLLLNGPPCWAYAYCGSIRTLPVIHTLAMNLGRR